MQGGPAVSILLLHSIDDEITRRRIERAERNAGVSGLTLAHAYVMKDPDFDSIENPGHEGATRLTDELLTLAQQAQSTLLIVHPGMGFQSYPTQVREALQSFCEQLPKVAVVMEREVYDNERLIDGLQISPAEPYLDLIEMLF